MKLRKLHIEDYKMFKDFDIDFLAGVNGSGKTRLLEFIKDFLAKYIKSKVYEEGFAPLNHQSLYDEPKLLADTLKYCPNLTLDEIL